MLLPEVGSIHVASSWVRGVGTMQGSPNLPAVAKERRKGSELETRSSELFIVD